MNTALSEQKTSNNIDLHKNWIRKLLSDYYDPMYEYQLSKKLQRVVFRGKKNEFLDWASHIDRKKN
jgi:tRNA 2-selenouridine synthase